MQENQSLKLEIETLSSVLHEKQALITEYAQNMEEIEKMRSRVIEIVQKRDEQAENSPAEGQPRLN